MASRLLFVYLAMLVLLSLLWENQGVSSSAVSTADGQSNIAFPYGSRQGTLRPADCSPRCTARCSATAYKKPCLFYCNKCCAKCLCVPPGTYGNKQTCPCYNNWKTKRGSPKCP